MRILIVEDEAKVARALVKPFAFAELLAHLFKRFYRVDKSRSRILGGAGLGLSPARHFVELHGGRIGVRSEAGQGTTFEVAIPCSGESRH